MKRPLTVVATAVLLASSPIGSPFATANQEPSSMRATASEAIEDRETTSFQPSRGAIAARTNTLSKPLNPKKQRVRVQVSLRSPECLLRLGRIRGKIRQGKKEITKVSWDAKDDLGDGTSCGDATTVSIRVEKGKRLQLYVGGELCTTFKTSYLLSRQKPQVSCTVDADLNPIDDSVPPQPSPAAPQSAPQFNSMDELASALAARGVACPGTGSVHPLQRTCSYTFALTIWPSPVAARDQAIENVALISSVLDDSRCQFLVVGNALLSVGGDPTVLTKLSDLRPVVYSCPNV